MKDNRVFQKYNFGRNFFLVLQYCRAWVIYTKSTVPLMMYEHLIVVQLRHLKRSTIKARTANKHLRIVLEILFWQCFSSFSKFSASIHLRIYWINIEYFFLYRVRLIYQILVDVCFRKTRFVLRNVFVDKLRCIETRLGVIRPAMIPSSHVSFDPDARLLCPYHNSANGND